MQYNSGFMPIQPLHDILLSNFAGAYQNERQAFSRYDHVYMEWCLRSDAAGFSGHGFKFSSAVGRSLCEMSTAENTKYETAAVVFSFIFVSMPDHVSRQQKSGMEETKEDVIWQTKPQEK